MAQIVYQQVKYVVLQRQHEEKNKPIGSGPQTIIFAECVSNSTHCKILVVLSDTVLLRISLKDVWLTV